MLSQKQKLRPFAFSSVFILLQWCQGKCLSIDQPCNGSCSKLKPRKCGDTCLATDGDFIECGPSCIKISEQCNGQCNKMYPRKCGNECVAENSTENHECAGKCIHASEQCMGNCMNPSKPVKCGTECIDGGEDSNYQFECEGMCISTNAPCKGQCSDKRPKKCGDKCLPSDKVCYVWDKTINGLRKNDTTA